MDQMAKNYNMKLNVKKTKTMLVSRKEGGIVNIVIDGQLMEQVKKFKYLGSLLTEDGKCEAEVKVRIGMAKDAFNKRKELLTRRMDRTVKKKIIKSVIWSVALYGCETWTLRKNEMQRLNALEMWMWRRMEKISWKDHRTNEEVLRLVDEDRQIVTTIVRRKKNWIGHIVRGHSMLKDVIEGRMEGKRPRGRPRLDMLNELKENLYDSMKRLAENSGQWRCWMPRTCL